MRGVPSPAPLGAFTLIGEAAEAEVGDVDVAFSFKERDEVDDSLVDAKESARSDADNSFDRVRPIFFEGVWPILQRGPEKVGLS